MNENDDIIAFTADDMDSSSEYIYDSFPAYKFSLREWQKLLSLGWRHNSILFYRVNIDVGVNGEELMIMPLRYRLKYFEMSKKHRKICRINQDLTHRIVPLNITDDIKNLFKQHTTRFKYNVPPSVYEYVSARPRTPFLSYQLEVYKNNKLIAFTFIDLTRHTLSSTYAAFDINESKRSLGIYTMLLEIQYAIEHKKTFHYPGYAHHENTHMDYKKYFKGAEYFDWEGEYWTPLILI